MNLIKFHNWMKNRKKKEAFTLVEILLYLSLVSVISITIVSFFSLIVQVQKRSQTVSEVDQNAVQLMEILSRSIRTASAVNSPAVGTTASSISINTSVVGNNPTVFDLVSGVIRIKEGAAATVNISSNNVTASGLTFRNLTGTSTKSTIQFQFTLSYLNPDNTQESNYIKTYYGAATLR